MFPFSLSISLVLYYPRTLQYIYLDARRVPPFSLALLVPDCNTLGGGKPLMESKHQLPLALQIFIY